MTNAEFESFKKFICSFEDGDRFQFHFDYGEDIFNFSIYRIGKKLKVTSDTRTKCDEEFWVLDNEEWGENLDMDFLKWIGSLDTRYMRQGWRDIPCQIHF